MCGFLEGFVCVADCFADERDARGKKRVSVKPAALLLHV